MNQLVDQQHLSIGDNRIVFGLVLGSFALKNGLRVNYLDLGLQKHPKNKLHLQD